MTALALSLAAPSFATSRSWPLHLQYFEGRMATWVSEFVVPIGTLLLGAGGAGFWAWMKARSGARATVEVAEVKQASDLLPAIESFQTALNKTAEGMLSGLRAELAAVKTRVQELEDENVHCRAENASLRASQHILIEYLRGQGLTVPESALPNIITHFEHGTATIHDVAEPLKG